MGFKFTTTAVQFTGMTHSLSVLGPKWFVKGAVQLLGSGNPAAVNRNVKMAMEKSKILQDRATTFNRDVHDALRLMEQKGEFRNMLTKAAFWPIVKMQLLVDVQLWLGAYYKGLSLYKADEDKAVEYADTQVIEAQGSGLFKDLSAIERGTTGRTTRLQPLVRMFTIFYSYFNTKLQLAYRATKSTDIKSPRQVAELAGQYALLFWLEVVFGEYMLQRVPDFDDDDEESAWWWHVKMTLQAMAATLPGIRDIAGIMQGFSSAPGGTRGLESIGRALSSGGKAVTTVMEDGFEEVNWGQLLRSTNKAASIVFKYPASQMNQILRTLEMKHKGEEPEPLDYLRYKP